MSTTRLRKIYAIGSCVQFRALVVTVFLFAHASTGFATEAKVDFAEANMIVNTLHEKLLHIMKNAEQLGYEGRYSEMQDFVAANFDTALIAKVIMSRYWKKLNMTQQKEFIELFRRLSVSTYASRFNGYAGENFVNISDEMLQKGRLLIKTELQRLDDEPVKLDYLMHQKEGKWLVISIIANGVNDLSLKRAEYRSVIKDRGFNGLVEDITSKITEMEHQHEP